MKTVIYWEGKQIIIPNPLNIVPVEGHRISYDDFIYTVDLVYINFDTSTIDIFPTSVRV